MYNKFLWGVEKCTKNELITKLARSQKGEVQNDSYNNIILDSMHDNFDLPLIDVDSTYSYRVQAYIIESPSGKIIMPEDIFSTVYDKYVELNKDKIKHISRSQPAPKYSFRNEPVPYVHKYHYHFHNYYRSLHLGRARKQQSIPEYAEYVNTSYKYKNLPQWDDRPRHLDRSWKTSYKIEKQWMKHCKKHIETDRFNKRTYSIDNGYFENEAV
jgi:hypothetical protein